MRNEAALDVVLCWHMHQPWYVVDGAFVRPWVYLHALKDYADMAAHLEAHPHARAVVNFVPVLVEQLERYARAVEDRNATTFPDPLLAALSANNHPEAPDARIAIVRACLAAAHERAASRFRPYADALAFARATTVSVHGDYLSDAFLDDLVLWTHLVWFGEHDHRTDPCIRELVARGRGFGSADRARLFALVRERLAGILPRYRELARAGRIELAVSPWAHPLVPLLIDLEAAHDTQPLAPLPEPATYPGGTERARWHLDAALATMERCFGIRPRGCWPPEAAVSSAALELFGASEFEWAVSSGAVLAASLTASLTAGQERTDCVHRSFRHGGIQTFFRDDGISDLIGFSYKNWHAVDAVNDLVGHLHRIARECARPEALVTVALDGENAWEHYPENAYEFLDTLYRRLATEPGLHLTTFAAHLDRGAAPAPLDRIVAGSWVYGSLATWIGHPEKNRAWELLIEAKRRFDAHAPQTDAQMRALGVCEGSDWFWWLGDDNSSTSVASFDQLYRAHVKALYEALGEPPPTTLTVPLSRGGAEASAHTMRPTRG